MKKLLPMLAVLFLLAAQPVSAGVPASPEPGANPVLAMVLRTGGKIYYLGKNYGLDGWFIVKDSQVQIAYATPDNKGIVAGGMFGSDGENVTTGQVGSLVASNDTLKEDLARIGGDQPAAVAAAAALSPGEKLIKALTGEAASLVVGPSDKPELIMVMSPFCPHCHAAWKVLRDRVARGDLHVRLVPTTTSNSAHEIRAAATLLQDGNFEVWDKFVGGDLARLDGTPSEASTKAVAANRVLADKWKIDMTPFLVYRGKDGKVKIIKGEPANLPALFADLGVP